MRIADFVVGLGKDAKKVPDALNFSQLSRR